MHFVKMHGLGNDFVLVRRKGRLDTQAASRLAVRLCDRRRGIGADGLIFVLPSARADFRMRIFNADGSEPEMCGNGIRCIARFARDERLTAKQSISIETLAGIKRVSIAGRLVTVDMGAPVVEAAAIPVRWPKDRVVEEPLAVPRALLARADGGRSSRQAALRITCVSMGNPHCVVFVRDVRAFPVGTVGPFLERHRIFPRRTNVEFVEVLSRGAIAQRTWERGVGETDACGTGACAAAYAAFITRRTGRNVAVHLRGGALRISLADSGRLMMTGPAERVFAGEFQPRGARNTLTPALSQREREKGSPLPLGEG
ncbi:MAG: diaminopimelate epimerase, partial [Planctomycetota bacterium]|nr:diaminopimelate epimerase [Planctomycetota bacterium]